MASEEWTHFATIKVNGRPPYLGSGTDPKGMVHDQYPLVKALESAAAAVLSQELKNNIALGTEIKLEISLQRFDFDKEKRVNAPRIIGGISNVLEGVNFISDSDVRDISYSEAPISNGGSESYEVKVYHS